MRTNTSAMSGRCLSAVLLFGLYTLFVLTHSELNQPRANSNQRSTAPSCLYIDTAAVCFVHADPAAVYVPAGGPVYVNPNNVVAAPAPSAAAAANVVVAVQPTSVVAAESANFLTQTVYGFLDFTTTIGNTVMVFSPQSAPPPAAPTTGRVPDGVVRCNCRCANHSRPLFAQKHRNPLSTLSTADRRRLRTRQPKSDRASPAKRRPANLRWPPVWSTWWPARRPSRSNRRWSLPSRK